MHQHITYNEWLPVILGPRVLTIFELTLNPNGHYDRYNASVNPSVANAFAAAAFRFGHSLIKSRLEAHSFLLMGSNNPRINIGCKGAV